MLQSVKRTWLWLLVLALLFGFALRVYDIGAEPLRHDEVSTDYLAFRFGHDGQRSLLGVRSSIVFNQSPFFTDVLAMSFAFSPDPRMARLFLALVHLVSSAALVLLIRRYWSPRAAFAVLLIYDVLPRAVWSARYVWNPSLVPPFIIAFYLTGLLAGDQPGKKRWARWLNPIFLCCAFQSHPIAILSAALFPAFFLRDWLRARQGRRTLLLDYLGGTFVSILLLIPWVYGLLDRSKTTPIVTNFAAPGGILDTLRLLVNNPTQLVYVPNTPPLYIPASPALLFILQGIGALSIFAAIFIFGRGLVRRQFPDALIGASFLVPPLIALALPRSYDHYFIPLLPATAIVLGLVLVGSRPRACWLAWGGWAAIFTLGLVQVGYFAYFLHIFAPPANPTYTFRNPPTLDEVAHFQDQAVRPGLPTVYYVGGNDGLNDGYYLLWQMLGARKPQSIIVRGESVSFPVLDSGATIITYLPENYIPPELNVTRPRLIFGNQIAVIDLAPHSIMAPTCVSGGPSLIANGATILGYYTPADEYPIPGKPWTIDVLWRSRVSQDKQDYQIFNHVVDGHGIRQAQFDGSALKTPLWRDDETMINRVSLTFAGTYNVDQPLYLRVGMYSLPSTQPLEVLDNQLNPVARWVTIPLCRPEIMLF